MSQPAMVAVQGQDARRPARLHPNVGYNDVRPPAKPDPRTRSRSPPVPTSSLLHPGRPSSALRTSRLLSAASGMGNPTVELVPPTPSAEPDAAFALPSRRASPTPPSSEETATLDTLLSTARRRPSSSETTAVTIYSMYGDLLADPDDTAKPPSPPPSSFQPQQQQSQAQSQAQPQAQPQPHQSQGRSSRSSSLRRAGLGHTPSHSGHGSSAASVSLAYLEGRPDSQRMSRTESPQPGRLTPDAASLRTSAFTPPPAPKQLPLGAYLSPATLSHASVATSPTSVSHRSPSGSLSLSIKRADAEDPDSFHVRATYAQLDVSGVPRDGVDDGIERTRARLGASLDDISRSSLDRSQQQRGADLDDKELAVLSSLDRYGFFRTENHDRLVRVPAAALAKPPAAGKAAPPPAAAPSPAQLALSALPADSNAGADPAVELRRIDKWGRMIAPKARDQGSNVQLWAVVPRKEHKLRERVYKGIPDRWRTAAWELLVRRYVGDARMDLAELAREYRDAIDRPSTFDIQIDLDVPRTITGHIMFRTRYGLGQRALFHVLHAFSLLCDECGYCQGMGPIAATLLCYYEPERVYAMLVQLHSPGGYNMHTIFAPGFPGLLEAIYVQERMTEKMLPAVWTSFKKHNISTTSYATKWYITLFSNSMPFRTQLRVWDALFLEGEDVLVVLAVAIVWGFRDQLGSPTASFESILSLLSSMFVPEQDDALLRWVSRIMGDSRLRADIRIWREQWRALVRDGKDAGVLL